MIIRSCKAILVSVFCLLILAACGDKKIVDEIKDQITDEIKRQASDKLTDAVDNASCRAAKKFLFTELDPPAIYVKENSSCIPLANLASQYPEYYSSSQCSEILPYTPSTFTTYCKRRFLDDNRKVNLGNPRSWRQNGDIRYASLGKNSRWRIAYGARANMLIVSPANNQQPFLKQVDYRNVNGCHLEMRIYKKNPLASNQKSVMLIHGGSWKYRGLGVLGMEAMVSFFTERDYVVFMPFYRLMGDNDGPSECQLPLTDPRVPGEFITADIEAALDWVRTHKATVGADFDNRIVLMGQSAGSHLALWLATHHNNPNDIKALFLLYPPTDMVYLIQQSLVDGGLYADENKSAQSKHLVSEFLGREKISDFDLNGLDDFVLKNSFPEAVRSSGGLPPTFIIHGNADKLVPVVFSSRLCDAMASLPYNSTPIRAGEYICGNASSLQNKLYIIDKAKHMLDMRCLYASSRNILLEKLSDLKAIPEYGSKFCPSGPENEALIQSAINEAFQWLE